MAPRQPHESESCPDPGQVAQTAHERRINAERRVETQQPEEEIQGALLGADFEGQDEDHVLNQRGEPPDGVGLQIRDVQAHAEADQHVLEHEDRATEILEQERLPEATGSLVIEVRNLRVHVRERRPLGLEALGEAVERSEEHTSELQSPCNLVCRLLLEKKKKAYCNPKPSDRLR